MPKRERRLFDLLEPPHERGEAAVTLWAIAAWSWVLAVIGIVGWVTRPHLAPLWAVVLGFSLATTPRWLSRRLRSRRAKASAR